MNRALYLQNDSPLGEVIHQHHYLLLFAWKLKQGLINQTSPDILKNYIEYFFRCGLINHLEKEEEVLFNEVNGEDFLKKKLEIGHNTIREKIMDITSSPSIDLDSIESLCKILISVVRYEEKELIPYLEKKLNKLESSWIKYEMIVLDEEIEDNFQPEFWNENRGAA